MECRAVGGGPVGDPNGCPFSSRTPLALGDKYEGMTDGAAVNIKRGGTGCAEMTRCPLPTICTRSPRPPQILLRLQRRLLYMTRPRFPK